MSYRTKNGIRSGGRYPFFYVTREEFEAEAGAIADRLVETLGTPTEGNPDVAAGVKEFENSSYCSWEMDDGARVSLQFWEAHNPAFDIRRAYCQTPISIIAPRDN